MTHVKICGFQTAEPVRAAIEAGADAVGLVFVPSAGRCITIEQAEGILSEVRTSTMKMPKFVGLFADQPVEEVNLIVRTLGLDAVQLCGEESMAFSRQMSTPIYKVIGIDAQVPVAAQMPRIMVTQQRHALAGHRIVIDAKTPGVYGGTGQRLDWELARDLARAFELCLAGGLSPENVQEAIEQVHPWGVDASSGVETDGVKDAAKVAAFVDAVRASEPRRRGRLARMIGMR